MTDTQDTQLTASLGNAARPGKKSQVHVYEAGAAEVLAVMNRATKLCDVLEDELARRPFGRPRQWTVKGILAGILLLARHEHAFFIDRIESLVATLPHATRESLELNRPDGNPFTTRQFSYAWNEISRVIDPAQPGVTDPERTRRLELCTWVNNELLWATTPREFRRSWRGDLAVDATLVWSHGRPAGSAKDKHYATGKDGDGLPTFLSKVDPCVFEEPDETSHPFLHHLVPNSPADEAFHSNGRRRRRDRKRRAVGARWIGNTSQMKVVHGYAHHVAVACAPDGTDFDLPPIALGQVTTPSTSNPSLSARILLDDLRERRSIDPELPSGTPVISDVLADGGYSQAKPEYWTLPIRSMGGEPVFRLHGQNQEGHRGGLRDGQLLHIDGRYYCSCLPEHLRTAVYPHRPTRDRALNTRKKAQYRALILARKPFEMKSLGRYRNLGLRFASPHPNNDCPRCKDETIRCCASKTVSLTWDQLGTYQNHQFGSPEWETSYNRRNRVEGFFGVLKNEAVGRHNRGCARFFEYAKITLTLTFNSMATNLHLIDLWRQRQRDARPPKRTGRPRLNATLDEIAETPVVLDETRKRKRRRKKGPPPPATPKPNPFAHLGADPA